MSVNAETRLSESASLSAQVARICRQANDWSPVRVLDEGMDLLRDATWADRCTLLRVDGEGAAAEVARRPASVGVDGEDQPADWFPWGLAPLNAKRFVLVSDATHLASAPDGPTFGELGVASCVHLPILERQRTVGAIQLFWCEPRLAWDDDRGRLLRVLGRFLLDHSLHVSS